MKKNLFCFKNCLRTIGCVIWIFLMACCGRQNTISQAEKIFVNGHILTMDESYPEAEALAIGQGKILAVGNSIKIKKSYPGADVIDLAGKTVMPGIIESHGHLLSLGQSFLELNLEGIATPEEAAEKVRQRALQTPAGAWITGWGWDEGAWAKNYPADRVLSEAAPKNPVYLRGLHVDPPPGQAAFSPCPSNISWRQISLQG